MVRVGGTTLRLVEEYLRTSEEGNQTGSDSNPNPNVLILKSANLFDNRGLLILFFFSNSPIFSVGSVNFFWFLRMN